MLTNVKTLDLAYLSWDHCHPLASEFPDTLFYKATAIRLSEVMDLAAHPAKLEHLIWCKFQQPAHNDILYHQAPQRQA